ncbi:MAG: PQQ-binding-like beta-propeller repeat protein [Planctomycetaceae bacterium]|nr:PQQ-binding-like beta-propeller repeat protein [Planctomycetaceae bacterium]
MNSRTSCSIPVALTTFLPAIVALTASAAAIGEDWSAFRGPHGNGVSDAVRVPVEWSADNNVAWKSPLPGRSNGSPVVSGNRILLTSATDEGHKRNLHCFDTSDGHSLWVRTAEFDKTMPTHETNQYGGSTPATNGQYVLVWHGSAGLFCFDLDGQELWKQDLGEFRHQWGYGTSPVIHGDRVILHTGPGKRVFVAAFRLKDGQPLWKAEEPVDGDGDYNSAKKYMGSWSTPVIVSADGRDIAVCSLATRVNGYDVETGDIVWTCDGLSGDRGDLAYTSPVIAGDICVSMGGFKGPAVAFRMGGSGNITAERRLWREDHNNPQRIGSGVFVGGHIYMANAGANTIECIEPETGKALWQERSPGAAHWGSLVLADGRLYTTDQEGTTVVFRPTPEKLDVLAVNRLNSPGNSTPAVADHTIFIRTFESLYCIREQ